MSKRASTTGPAERSLASRIATAPQLVDAAAARARVADWLAQQRETRAGAALAALFARVPRAESLIAAIAEHSPYLRELAFADPERLLALLEAAPEDRQAQLLAEVAEAVPRAVSEADAMRLLRRKKAEAALLSALSDIGGVWPVMQVTRALTEFADAAVAAAVRFLLAGAAAQGKLRPADAARPEQGSAYVVLAMGKMGAFELNYSSDIDLIVLFDAEAAPLAPDVEPAALYIRLTRALVRLLQERTAEGYVFRVDLRLRPDPASTQIAVSLAAALSYYESIGQNWERAALIKARPCGGDLALGQAFLKEVAPFVWRKYLDYAAVGDIRDMKRQIHAYKGHDEIAIEGHNIKLGRGGIREIEFFAQTQQLIAGGRVPALRPSRTIDALAALEAEGWIDARTRDDLADAYWYLRAVEHRIQMVADEQSHTLPEDRDGLTRIALMMGEPNARSFAARLTGVLKSVERRYAGLFEASPELTAGGNLVFTGDDDDPATVETLSAMGFARPSEVIKTVRGWHFGRFPAVRTAQARELLTELTPGLLQAVADTGEADATLFAFDRFLSGLPAGIQLFSLLNSNPGLMRLMVRILGSAPRLAEIVTRRPHVFDGLLDPSLASTVPGRRVLSERLAAALARAPDYEGRLDAARIFVNEQKFAIGAALINRTIPPAAAGRAFSDLADVMIGAMIDAVWEQFAVRHGRVDGGQVAVLGMGRLGSRELTFGSDLDLILLYDHAPDAEFSDGPKPLAVSQYFMRLGQRLIAAMSAPTAEGVIYELDFRLRPSGNAGPLATHFDAFVKYQGSEAWTWERQALTRARPLAGSPALCERAEQAIRDVLSTPIEPARLHKDVCQMRALIDKEKATDNPFEVKTARGGLIDVEFLAQWALLRAGLASGSERPTSVAAMLVAAGPDLIPPDDRETLSRALSLFNDVLQLLRLCIDDGFDPATAPRGLSQMLCEQLDLPDIRTVDGHLRQTETAVRAVFDRLLR
ncbi:MAG: glutamate-ammonia-ligase adenylyltransferase [Alphaproteobacteria bacterium]|nr:MAG: glutamate-ammonia-ligase adenylyltransferase [Alphaproteobacteria bacterium]